MCTHSWLKVTCRRHPDSGGETRGSRTQMYRSSHLQKSESPGALRAGVLREEARVISLCGFETSFWILRAQQNSG